MLKDLIRVRGNIKQKEYNSVHELVKEYFRLYIDKKINGFDDISYRGHSLIIHDLHGYTDAVEIEEDLCRQIQEINNKDGE